jgi:phosphatidylethanolamine/phosphatidyl-N-methylethanolamine N-methyltransferase
MNFFKQFLKRPKETAAVVASSRELSKLIVDMADLNGKKCVVELGPGTGAFTREILDRIDTDTLFFCLEINRQFVSETKQNCPEAIVYHASATDIGKYLKKNKKETCDCVISGLPWALLDSSLQEELLNSIYDSLDEGGVFLTIAHITGLIFPPGRRFKKLLDMKFNKVSRSRIIWGNMFPGFIYRCTK